MFNLVYLLLLMFLCRQNYAEVIQAQTDEACELKVNGSILILSVDKTWSSSADPCKLYKCKGQDDGETRIDVLQLVCNTSRCNDDFIYKTLPTECCGKCVSSFCQNDGKMFKAGDIWKSEDNCTVNECIDTGFDLVVTSYKKSCPRLKNCPEDSIVIRDCCPYCNFRRQKNIIEINEIEFTTRDSYRSHPCLRDCVERKPMTCYYEFVIEQFQTMSKACYNCPSNETDCFRPHCISADGMKRSISVVNRMMPGPSIEVCLNDTIIVDVKNRLMSEGTSIHWHGMHQKKSPFMDGVPHVSQCPIPAGQNFRYNFIAQNAGTHFWHSHLGMQRGDGVFGAMVVRNPSDPHENLYDFDMSEHTIIINDWTHLPANSVFTAHHHGGGDNKPPNILINGRGKYFGNMTIALIQNQAYKIEVFEETSEDLDVLTTSEATETTSAFMSDDGTVLETTENKLDGSTKSIVKRALLDPSDASLSMPYEVFNVVKGHRYRFRHVNAGFLNCPIELSIDNHTLTAIASDGNSLQPTEATFLTTYAGERWDFIVNANQEEGNYFIRARGLMDCDERFTSSFQMAILHYSGAAEEDPPGVKPSYEMKRQGLGLNALNRPQGQLSTMTVAEMKSVEQRTNHIMKAEPDLKFFLSYDFYGKDNPLFHVANLYGFNEATFGRIYTPQINHITMRMPSIPAMLGKSLLEQTFCNETSLAAHGINCKETFCECTHVLQVPLKSVVEIILIDEGVTYDANHMFHLHGHFFHVVGMDRLSKNVTVQEVKELDKLGRLKRKLANSPQKDTVTVPDGGYTIIRFYADNPGIWLLHCHIDFHAEVGMALLLKIGDYNQMPPVPRNFPTCNNYIAESSEIIKSSASNLGFQGVLLMVVLAAINLLV